MFDGEKIIKSNRCKQWNNVTEKMGCAKYMVVITWNKVLKPAYGTVSPLELEL